MFEQSSSEWSVVFAIWFESFYRYNPRVRPRVAHQSQMVKVDPSLWIVQYPPRHTLHTSWVLAMHSAQLGPHSKQLRNTPGYQQVSDV
jgi:hypothetical protein